MNVRNFVIIAHIDHGKSTLADRFLELTGTVEPRRMRPQYLDRLELERERGITIKMAPVRMHWRQSRGVTQTKKNSRGLLCEDLTDRIKGALFRVYNSLGPGHKESVYQNAIAAEFNNLHLTFEREKRLDVSYNGKKVGVYQPDFVVENKVLLELKTTHFFGEKSRKRISYYLRGSEYQFALLVNFGANKLEIENIVCDAIRDNPYLNPRESAGSEYILNLIDTPGHSDFSYEVSRALAAVEGAILLVDATKGIQAQTLANLRAARKAGLTVIGAVNKVDLRIPNLDRVAQSVAELLDVPSRDILRVSAKTGEGVEQLLDAVVERIPPPRFSVDQRLDQRLSALIFDSFYDDHKGILAFVRVFSGEVRQGAEVMLAAKDARFIVKEVGMFRPEFESAPALSVGEIGYVATGLKEPGLLRIGDTITKEERKRKGKEKSPTRLGGYKEPPPVVFVSFYPSGKTTFEELKKSLDRLRLSDPALSFEPDSNDAFGRGFKVGFLGQLHFEITSERLRRDYSLEFVTSFPSIAYRVRSNGRETVVTQADRWPERVDEIFQPIIIVEILTPPSYLPQVLALRTVYDIEVVEVESASENVRVTGRMPLSEFIRDFDDRLKSVSSGFASFSYERDGEEEADVVKLEILIAGELQTALTRIVSRKDVGREARATVERLKELLPREQFSQAIQARAVGRILARETVPALRKDVTGYLYGGDRSRKMKLWKKQKRGKEKLAGRAKVRLSAEVFRELLKK